MIDNFTTPLFLDLLGIYVLMGVSWYIPASCGQFSFGHAGLMGIAAYLSGAMTTILGLPFSIALIAGMGISCLAGIVFSAVGLKSKDVYAAIMTLALAQIAVVVFKAMRATGGIMGFLVTPKVTPLIVWVAVVLCLVFTWRLENSRLGRTFEAIKSSNIVSSTLGLNTIYYKIIAFGLGGGLLAGLGFFLRRGGLGAFLGFGRALLLVGTLLRGGLLRRAVRALFRSGGGFVGCFYVGHLGYCPFGG